MEVKLGPKWQRWMRPELESESFDQLCRAIKRERQKHLVFPPAHQVFRAFELTDADQVRVVILGQDPYHGEGQAHGLAFSVPDVCGLPPSLRNIFRELASDLDVTPPESGNLESWARQGVLLLNSVLTVRANDANSHRGIGWESWTDAVIQRLSTQRRDIAFVLWGQPAQRKRSLIDEARHFVIKAPHPSPLSAYRGFFGSQPFSAINRHLTESGSSPIQWA